jgi:8-oxo-dGTP pyrophosphatase MutT (NUDIX family)
VSDVEGFPEWSETEAARVDSLASGDGSWTPPRPRDAATVVLLRDGDPGLEVFMLRRASSMAFAAGMHVFPGGAIDDADAEVPTARLVTDADLDARTWSDRGRSVVVAAARETFEECGVLLGVDAAGRPAALDSDLEEEREALLRGELLFAAILSERGLVVDDSALVPFAHWVTPESEARRFDARFLAAAQPAGQQARHVGGEAERSAWWHPAAALAAYAEGHLPMWPPQLAVMRFLDARTSTEEAIHAARAVRVVPRMPESYRDADGALRVRLVHARTREFLESASYDDYGTDG